MSFPWVICLAREDAAAVADLRLTNGVEVAEADGRGWLRGPSADESLATGLQRLPAVARYEALKDNRLRKLECSIPSEQLPPLAWQPLKTWMQVTVPDEHALLETKPETPVF